MLVFFAVSGIWQNFGLHYGKDSHRLMLASTIHTGREMKTKSGEVSDLSSPLLRWFVIAMALGMILTTLLGVVMAFRFGKGRAASICLAAGVLIPASLILIKLFA